ncbi:MAG: hypothetical protein PHI90_09980, partial [Clostridia bacterium]|nr:hypothetical protein [Clostridia bacterium]MDD4049118.1 hypothetical protein [Clostridia bacterium]
MNKDIDKKANNRIDDNVDNEIKGSLDNETTNEIDSKVAIELEQLEKEMGTKISELPEPPLNQEFQKSMRNTILEVSSREQSENMNHNIENDSITNEHITNKHITNGNIENENIVKERVKERINEEINKSNRRGLLTTIKKSFINSRNFKIAASFLIIAFVFGGLFWGLGRLNSVVQPVIASELDIKALQEDKLGVDTKSAFLLTCETPLDEKTVKENLKVEPAFEYTLDKRAEGKEYRIVPSIKLASNTVYSISFDPTGKERESCSWAFQTKSS